MDVNSFEPGPIRKLQKANVQINGLENDITIDPNAVSDADGPTLLTSDAGYHIAARLDTMSREFDFYSIVEAITLDTVLAEKEKSPDWQPEHTGIIVKLDCNGFEPTVVKGARQIFENYNTIWVVEFLGFSLDLDTGNGQSYLSFLDDFLSWTSNRSHFHIILRFSIGMGSLNSRKSGTKSPGRQT